MEWTWRPYQIECKSNIKKEFQNGVDRQLIVEATGCGKRQQSLDLIQHFEKTLFLAHREELISQAYNDAFRLFPMQVGIVKGKSFEIDKKIVCASVQTLYNRLDKIDPNLFDLVIIDEAHHYCAKSYLETIRYFRPRLQTAWTATPKRLDGLSLTNIADKIVFEYRIEDGIRDGYLAKIDAYQIKTQTDLSQVKRIGGDFNQKQLSETVDSPLRNTLIVHKYKEYAEGRQFIAFCASLAHCQDLKKEFDEEGIDTEIVVSHKDICTPEQRNDRFGRFKSGQLTGIINIDIATEGFDYSDVGCLLMTRPTQSEAKYVQMVGRSTRLFSMDFMSKFYKDEFNSLMEKYFDKIDLSKVTYKKDNKAYFVSFNEDNLSEDEILFLKSIHSTAKSIVLDFVDISGKHSLINSYELEKGKDLEDKIFLPDEYREKLIEKREARKAKEITIKVGTDQKIDLLKLPEVNVWDSPKMLELATEKQLIFMQRLGVYQEGVEYTKAMASEAISNSKCDKKWQLDFLAQQGYDVSNGATLGQYQIVKRKYDSDNKYKM